MKGATAIAAVSVLFALPVTGGEPLRMTTSPSQSFAPAHLTIQVRIAPFAENGALEVLAQSEDFYRSSEIQLEGDRAPATIQFQFRAMPAGDYDVVGILKDRSGHKRSIVHSQVHVIATGSGG